MSCCMCLKNKIAVLRGFSSMLWLSYCLPRVIFYELHHLKTSRYAYKGPTAAGFEPADGRPSVVFKTTSISLSDTLP